MKHVSRTHRRQLIDIAHHDQGGRGWNGFEKMVHEQNVDHGCFVDKQNITIDGVFVVFLKAPLLHAELKKPVNGFGFVTGGFAHSLCRPAGGRSQHRFGFKF